MTRSSKLALVTLLVGLLSLASVGTASATAPCTGFAQEHCEATASAQTAFVALVHLPGYAQEQYEAMSVVNPELFIGAPAILSVATAVMFGQEHYEEITTTVGLNKSGSPSRTAQFGQEHYEEIMAAQDATN